MNAGLEIAVDYGPILLAAIFPFVRVLRSGRAKSSFFICWGLIAISEFAFAAAVPIFADRLGGNFPQELPGLNPRSAAIVGILGGWFYAAITVLLGTVFRLPVQLRTQRTIGLASPDQTKSKRRIYLILSLLVALGIPFKYFDYSLRPPREESLIQTFSAHRSSFERLHALFQADTGFEFIGDSGVRPSGGRFSTATEADFPVQRFNEYTALLKVIGARSIMRRRGQHAEIRIQACVRGSALGGYEIDYCNREAAPDRQVSNLNSYFRNDRSSAKLGWAYRHIDGSWYLGTDFRSE